MTGFQEGTIFLATEFAVSVIASEVALAFGLFHFVAEWRASSRGLTSMSSTHCTIQLSISSSVVPSADSVALVLVALEWRLNNDNFFFGWRACVVFVVGSVGGSAAASPRYDCRRNVLKL